ncbi:pentapeptide repeat-containing protein [Paenibacillus kandeliae]|uniref:pentapeptide repeat-containing protein n=1 Tax=Paenibacillus kandeliae TaxID=3231269 RepID=UPI00345A9360
MNTFKEENVYKQRREDLRADCEKCFGLCCVALNFSASEGFPIDKPAGTPCIHLQTNFRCGIHDALNKRGLKGCITFDCFGAGQKVSQVSYQGIDWRKEPDTAQPMFKVFLIMMQLHELLWYLTEALTRQAALPLHDEIQRMIDQTEQYTLYRPEQLMQLDIASHRDAVNELLVQISEKVRAQARTKFKHQPNTKSNSGRQKKIGRGADLIAADLRNTDLRGAHLRGSLLIAANLSGVNLDGADLIGADLRDAEIAGADLSGSLFLTQAQVNSAKGNSRTLLPPALTHPQHWHDSM